jgi:hypothetical protein
MSTNSFSKRIGHALAVRTDILLGSDPASASDDDGQQLTNTDGADDISNRLQTLLDIRAQLSDSSDSSDGDPLFTDNPRLAALFEKPRSGVDNDNLLRALGQVVSNSGGAGKRKKKRKKLYSQVRRRLWWILSTHQQRRIAVILRTNLHLIPQESHSSAIQVMMWETSLEIMMQVSLHNGSNENSL